MQIVSNLLLLAMRARFTVLVQPGLLARLLIKDGDVETNPVPTTIRKQICIWDICHKQIHGRKQIPIRCNRIEQWVHLRCAGIRLAQYTDTWTCHLHKDSRLITHTDISHSSRPCSKHTQHPHLPQTSIVFTLAPSQNTNVQHKHSTRITVTATTGSI